MCYDKMKYIQKTCPGILVISLIFTLAAVMILVGGAACNGGSQNQAAEIVSVTGPIPPFTPGGPAVEITLKNVSAEPITGLTATLVAGRPFDFNFEISPSAPLMPNQSISCKITMIGAGFDDTATYPLTVKATLQSGAAAVYTQQVQIKAPQ
ncbi:MAG: hypothetical protein ABSG90_11915 [Dehalococcoidia bacterium]|jgi:hypothetical protein